MKEPFFFFKNPWDVLLSLLPFIIVVACGCIFYETSNIEMPQEQRIQIYKYLQYSLFLAGVLQIIPIVILFICNKTHPIGAFFAIPLKIIISIFPALFLAGSVRGIIYLIQEGGNSSGGLWLFTILSGCVALFLCFILCKRSKSKQKNGIGDVNRGDISLIIKILAALLAVGIWHAKKENNRIKPL